MDVLESEALLCLEAAGRSVSRSVVMRSHKPGVKRDSVSVFRGKTHL